MPSICQATSRWTAPRCPSRWRAAARSCSPCPSSATSRSWERSRRGPAAVEGSEMSRKLVLAIVQDQDASRVVDALVADNLGATRINTHGGFLKRGNATLLVGVDSDE